MDLYAAIDVRGGACVRLVQGDYARERVYGGDPIAVAREFEAEGAPWVHVVDLDAARTGRPENASVVTARNSPRMRKAGRPTRTANPAVKAGAIRMASQNGTPTRVASEPAITPPTAANEY